MPAPPCVQAGADDEDEQQTPFFTQNQMPVMKPRPPLLLTQLNWKREGTALQRLPDRVARPAAAQHQHDAQMDARSNQDARTPSLLNDEPAEDIAAGNSPSAEKVWVCTSGSAPAHARAAPSAMDFSQDEEISRYNAGMPIAQPPINARCGIIRSAMTLEAKQVENPADWRGVL